MNQMRSISVEKVTLNIGAGKDQAKLEKGIKLIGGITGLKPVKTFTKKRIQEWGLRPGLAIGCKLTLRNKEALELLKRLLEAKDGTLSTSNMDNEGNISFGVNEYIDVPGVKYDPEIGIYGMDVAVRLERRGYRVSRKSMPGKVGHDHRIKPEEAREWAVQKLGVKVGEQ